MGLIAVIILDTHIWVWWTHGAAELTPALHEFLQANEADGFGVSAISCWEVAKLVERARLILPCPVGEWFQEALNYPGVQLLGLTPEVAVESTQLPGEFHRDPADQIIVATARIHNAVLVTLDRQIREYAHVRLGP